MKLSRVAVLLLVALAVCSGASWDGTRGPFTAYTFTVPTSVPGVSLVSSAPLPYTMIFITCSDTSLSALRVNLTYRDSGGEHTASFVVDLNAAGRGGVTTMIQQEQITGVTFIELREGARY